MIAKTVNFGLDYGAVPLGNGRYPRCHKQAIPMNKTFVWVQVEADLYVW